MQNNLLKFRREFKLCLKLFYVSGAIKDSDLNGTLFNDRMAITRYIFQKPISADCGCSRTYNIGRLRISKNPESEIFRKKLHSVMFKAVYRNDHGI